MTTTTRRLYRRAELGVCVWLLVAGVGFAARVGWALGEWVCG